MQQYGFAYFSLAINVIYGTERYGKFINVDITVSVNTLSNFYGNGIRNLSFNKLINIEFDIFKYINKRKSFSFLYLIFRKIRMLVQNCSV